jgi:hypothetical protein
VPFVISNAKQATYIGAELVLEDVRDLTVPGSLVFESGAALNWRNGASIRGAGSIHVEKSATITVDGGICGQREEPSDFPECRQLFGRRTLTNKGTINLSGGSWDLGQGVVIENRGLLEVNEGVSAEQANTLSGEDSWELHNTGRVRKTGSSFAYLSGDFRNDGAIQIDAGSLRVGSDTYDTPETSSSGSFDIAARAELWWSGLSPGRAASRPISSHLRACVPSTESPASRLGKRAINA